MLTGTTPTSLETHRWSWDSGHKPFTAHALVLGALHSSGTPEILFSEGPPKNPSDPLDNGTLTPAQALNSSPPRRSLASHLPIPVHPPICSIHPPNMASWNNGLRPVDIMFRQALPFTAGLLEALLLLNLSFPPFFFHSSPISVNHQQTR